MNIQYAFSIRLEDWGNTEQSQWAADLEESVSVPVALTSEIASSRKGVTFLKCPAHTDYLKNVFVFKSPIDLNLNIEISETTAKVYSDNLNQALFEKIIDVRFLKKIESKSSPYPLIGIDFLNSFVANESILMSVTPAFLHYNEFTEKTSVIPGEYDISKWVRPIECVFEFKKSVEQISIKKGDALCYFKFATKNNQRIDLIKSAMPWKDIDICAELRAKNPFKPLTFRYNSLKDHLNNE